MATLPAEVSKVLDRFDQALCAIEDRVAPFVEKPVKEVTAEVGPIEAAKLNLAYSYTMNSLFYMLLKVQGVSPLKHPVRGELERVKKFMTKTLAAEAEASKPATPASRKRATSDAAEGAHKAQKVDASNSPSKQPQEEEEQPQDDASTPKQKSKSMKTKKGGASSKKKKQKKKK